MLCLVRKNVLLCFAVASVIASCAPAASRYTELSGIENVPGSVLYSASLDFLIQNGYTILRADGDNLLITAVFINSYNGASYPATIRIAPLGSNPRITYNFTIGVKNRYEKYMSEVVRQFNAK